MRKAEIQVLFNARKSMRWNIYYASVSVILRTDCVCINWIFVFMMLRFDFKYTTPTQQHPHGFVFKTRLYNLWSRRGSRGGGGGKGACPPPHFLKV